MAAFRRCLRFVLSHTGMNAGLAERFRALVRIFQNGGRIAKELMETRCDRGAEIAQKMRFSEGVVEAIRNLDEHWDGSGMPNRLNGDAIPVYSQIALLAQVVNVFHMANSAEAATLEVRQADRNLVRSAIGGGVSRRSRGGPNFGRCCDQTNCRRRFSRSSRRSNAPSSMKTTSTISPPLSPRSSIPKVRTPAAIANA